MVKEAEICEAPEGASTDAGLRASRLAILHKTTRLDPLNIIILATAIAGTLHLLELGTPPAILGWLGAMTAGAGLSAVINQGLRRGRLHFSRPELTENMVAVLAGVITLGWSALLFLFWPEDDKFAAVIMTVSLLVLNFPIGMKLSISPRVFAVTCAALNGPILVKLIGAGATEFHVLVVVTLMSMAGAIGSAWELNRSISANLALGRRNRDLIRELRTALQRAEEANVAKTHFLANTSHELRTPLNAIIGFSELMKDEHMGPLDRKYRQYADDIHESGRHLLSVINDILDLAKIEADRMDVDAERVDLRAVWNTALRMVAPRAERAGVDLMAQIDGSLPPLLADERRLTQVAINLLANAIDFTPAGGDVVFRARLAEENGLIVTVSDTGVGMAPEEIPRALAPFEQVETGLARRRGGTGLGLSLSKRIVELLGGTMKVTSAAGIGTTVALHFPRNLVLSEIAPPTDTEPAQSISSGK